MYTRKHYTSIVSVLVVVFSTSFLFYLIRWINSSFGGVISFDQLLFYLYVPLKGTSDNLVQEGVSSVVLPSLRILFVAMLGLLVTARKKSEIVLDVQLYSFQKTVVVWPILIHKRRFWAFLALLFVMVSTYQLQTSYNIGGYIHSQFNTSAFIENHYVNPHTVGLQFPEKKRNLIYIYLESMESSYADIDNGGMFADNYIPNLTAIAKDNVHFSETDRLGGAKQITGTGWTIASLFAQSSGLHLNVPIYGNDMDKHAFFFPGVKSLGDVLAEQGYSNTLLIGSDALFGGRELYYSSHGDYEICDYKWAKESGKIPLDYYVWWGYEDAKLFEFAKEKLIELAVKEEPFNLTMLTVDTHHQDGYVSDGDYQDLFSDQYANVIATSDRQVAQFLQWIQTQDFYENTTIVIVGDHFTMDSDFFAGFESGEAKRVYNAFINVAGEMDKQHIQREFSLIDMYPTTLSALGIIIPGNRLGLGVNLFSSEETLLEKFGQEELDSELRKKSTFYNKLLFTPFDEL